MVFPGLYILFCGVATVTVGWDSLEIDVILWKDDFRRSEHSLSSMCKSGAFPFFLRRM